MTHNQPPSHPHFDAARVSSVLLPLLAFAIGFGVMFFRTSLQIAPQWAGYLSLAVVGGVDSVLGGVRAGMEGKFESDVFLSGFIVNTIAAVLVAWFGDAIGIQDVYLAAVVVFLWRILLNISMIRRFFILRARSNRASAAAAVATDRSPEGRGEARTGTGSGTGTDIVGA